MAAASRSSPQGQSTDGRRESKAAAPPRAEFIKCIADTHADNKGKTWCGRPTISVGWCFEGVDHAAMNGRNKARLIVCPECRDAAIAGLINGSENAHDLQPTEEEDT